ncbi:hypothetical protein FHG87_008321 [Trinorchestia longiramus]|nr:hypothetical protein FHG87_008321 [Trinorchestia longiramus]
MLCNDMYTFQDYATALSKSIAREHNASTASTVAIDNKIEQAMALVMLRRLSMRATLRRSEHHAVAWIRVLQDAGWPCSCELAFSARWLPSQQLGQRLTQERMCHETEAQTQRSSRDKVALSSRRCRDLHKPPA